MSDGEVKFKVGQKVVCSDVITPKVVGTVIGMYGENPEKTEWVGVKISEAFLHLSSGWHDASHVGLIDENGTALYYQSERNDCRFFKVCDVKVLGEV